MTSRVCSSTGGTGGRSGAGGCASSITSRTVWYLLPQQQPATSNASSSTAASDARRPTTALLRQRQQPLADLFEVLAADVGGIERCVAALAAVHPGGREAGAVRPVHVPRMRGDERHPRRLDAEEPHHVPVDLGPRLPLLHVVDRDDALEQH